MFGKRFLKRIKGIVLFDSNSDDGSVKKALKDIRINLFSIERKVVSIDGIKTTINTYKRLLTEKTNENGESTFLVTQGEYLLGIEVNDIPDGKGVIQLEKIVDTKTTDRANFIMKDIASIDVYNKPESIYLGEHLGISSTAKDTDNNIITAKIQYSCDSRNLDLDKKELRVVPKEFQANKVSLCAYSGNIKTNFDVNIELPKICSSDKINLAYRLGIIDEDLKILKSLHLLYDRQRLSKEYDSALPIKSGTGIVSEIRRYIGRPDAKPNIVSTARAYLSSAVPELEMVYRSPGGYFDIHYTMKGTNAVQGTGLGKVPQYIEQIGRAFDNVKSITCGVRGFREPVMEMGKKTFDIYVYDLKGIYGVTYSSKIYKSQRGNIASCYICIDNSYSKEKGFDKSREDCMKVTAAHEFFHAVQYSYNVGADKWWMEASATWNEDEIYTEVNDYVRYIGSYFSSPQKSLDEISYSGVIFAKHLSENYGGYEIIKRIWQLESLGYGNSIESIDRAIRERYSAKDIASVFNEFTAHNFNPAQYYKEGKEWNASVTIQNTYNSFPVSHVSGKLNHLSASYHLFTLSSMEKGKLLRVIADGSERARYGFKLQARRREDNMCKIIKINPKSMFERTEIVIEGFGDIYDEVCLVPANLEKKRDGLTYTYSARLQ